MPVAGIICEYNPFHNGHRYQIQELKTNHGMDAVVCAMSGHFMQRGEPALLHKLDRTAMALAAGADLVFELPALFATRSAYWFALGGVSLLAGTGVVSHLAFGAESTDLASLQQTAQALANPGPDLQQALQSRLKEGHSFVSAQAKALQDQWLSGYESKSDSYSEKTNQLPGLIPSHPNDRLALCYLQVLAQKKYPLTPVLIPRKDAAYHQSKPDPKSSFASAGAIRSLLETAAPQEGWQKVQSYLPPESVSILQSIGWQSLLPQQTPCQTSMQTPCQSQMPDRQTNSLRLVFPKDLEQVLLALLRRCTAKELRLLPDMTEGLENRILYYARNTHTMDDFYQQLKTKRYTLTRLQRTMLHLFLNYQAELASEIDLGCPYLRILGYNSKGQALLSQIKANGSLPLISRSGQLKALSRQQRSCANAWDLEVRSGDLYAWLQGQPIKGSPEYLLRPLIMP